MLPHPFPQRQPAPSLDGGVEWINTSGPIDLKDLRGKFVVLDFWTYCCINCMHVLPVLKQLEQAYPHEVVVIGVHSAKFDTEQDSKNIREAVLRYEIEHPVVNDAGHRIWRSYFSQSWPSLRIIDPEGYLVAGHSGEIDFQILDTFLKKSLPYYRQRGLLDTSPLHFDLEAHRAEETPLRFPGKILADQPSDRLFIADSNHNRIVITKLDGQLVEVVGSGQIGKADGAYRAASFHHPQGMALQGKTLYVADTENHLLRKIDLQAKRVQTIAGTGEQARGWPGMDDAGGSLFGLRGKAAAHKSRQTGLNSPWALWIHKSDLYIAMAGPHQIWRMPLDESTIGPYAGNGREDIVDGPLLPGVPYAEGYASFAQPSGLASDGRWLYVADSEGSSIRAVPFDPTKQVRTVVGTDHLSEGRLFAFGDTDGKGREVLLQHPLGIAWHEGLLYVADTYNNKIKVVDPAKQTSRTLSGTGKPGASDDPATFDEPAGLSVAAGKLYIADTNNHQIRVIDLKQPRRASTLAIAGLKPPQKQPRQRKPSFVGAAEVTLPEASLRPADGQVTLRVALDLPKGYKINELAPLRYLAEVKGKSSIIKPEVLGNLVDVPERASVFEIRLPLTATSAAPASGAATLKISLVYYYCQETGSGLCKAETVVWTVPIKLAANAKDSAIELRHAPR